MKEDDILARVGAHERERRAGDAAYERVARGEASEDEITPELEAARPLGPAAADRIASRLRPAPPRTASVVPLVRRIASVAAPLALAAAVVLFVATRTGGDGSLPLPGYTVTASGDSAMRGETAATSRLRVGRKASSRFEIVARPATAVGDAKVVAYVFAMQEGDPSALDADVDVSTDGAVRVAGEAKALRGAVEVRIVVGTPESLGSFEGALARAKTGASEPEARVLVVAIDHDGS